MSGFPAERVLVVPADVLRRLGYFQGFTSEVQRYVGELLSPENTCYRLRDQVEQDPGYKQLIPYVIFRYTDASGRQSLFRYTRGRGQGERRLHAKRSIGIGGHISSADGAEASPYREGMRRELDEEVIIQTGYRERCVGLINDDQTDVGRVHLGIVHLVDVDEPNVVPRESEIQQAGFVPVEELLDELDGMESWSQICLQALFAER